ncbi:MAG TPA: LytTR family DNA-binding domain-containing protein [Chitinophagales bacterium]|nr:LytTR family DNA-binding domain-containing protein [Chitinophagales bacterium]
MIIDDDEMSRRTLNHLVSQAEDLDLEDVCNNAIEAMGVLHSKKIDLLLLDIEMPGISGPQLLKSIHKPPLVIVISSKTESALQPFGLNVIGYIRKPVNPELFFKSVAKAKKLCDEVKNEIEFSEKDSIFIKNDGNRIELYLNEIILLEGKFDAVNIITQENEYTVNSSVNFLETKLDPERFIKVHRSFIVNMNKITSINDNKIIIHERVIPVAEDFKDNFNKRLNLLK